MYVCVCVHLHARPYRRLEALKKFGSCSSFHNQSSMIDCKTKNQKPKKKKKLMREWGEKKAMKSQRGRQKERESASV